MKNYKEMTRCILEARDEYDRKKQHHRIVIKRCTVGLSGLGCVLLLCFGIFGTWEKVGNMPQIDVLPVTTYPSSEDNTDTAHTIGTSSTSAVTVGTSVTVTVTVTDKTIGEAYEQDIFETEENEYEPQETEPIHSPAVTEIPVTTRRAAESSQPKETTVAQEAVTSQTAAETAAEHTEVTADITETVTEAAVTTEPVPETHTIHLLDSDDPITVFPVINTGGTDYEGYRYISAEHFKYFYPFWSEETVLSAYDTKRGAEVSEPVTIFGLKDEELEQEYVIVEFMNYELYGMYGAIEQPEQEQPEEEQPIDNE